ncbi:MAG: ribonuclease HIII [Planctomycetota bacterium]
MAQETLVVRLDVAAQKRLRARLAGGSFEFRPVEYARFSARGEGVVATLYTSGKLVVQGTGIDAFAVRYLEAGTAGSAARREHAEEPPAAGPTVGSDEAGKGDYFGPLVAVAFRLEPAEHARLARGGVADSKVLADETIRRLAPALQDRFVHAVEILDPPAYNAEHAVRRNLNPMLADLHARAIRRVVRPGDRVVIDRFAREELLNERLAGLDARIEQFPRAERELAVAAASVIARFVYLERLRELSAEYAVDLHKGAGSPTDAAARRFVVLHGRAALGAVAKLHFKNSARIPPGAKE